jgi:hypothetical protein
MEELTIVGNIELDDSSKTVITFPAESRLTAG